MDFWRKFLIFGQNLDFWTNFGYLDNTWILGENVYFLDKIMIFGQNLDLWTKFRLLGKKNKFSKI